MRAILYVLVLSYFHRKSNDSDEFTSSKIINLLII